MLYSNLTVNEQGHLAFAGYDTVELAKKYGTALYVIDEDKLRENCRMYIDAMEKHFGGGAMPLYASKALCFTEIYRIIAKCGMGTDIVSSGELYTAVKAGFPLEKAFFHGNNKTDADIEYAIKNGLGYFVVDNEEELDAISEIAGAYGVMQKILLRITPGIDPHTHKAIMTGSVDSKFGSAIETGRAYEMVEMALSGSNIVLKGFHCHIGSQIFECDPFCDAADIMLGFVAEVKKRYSFKTELLNLGGGFGVRYTEEDPYIDIDANIAQVASHVKKRCEEFGVDMPKILMEPGRSIVANTGITLYTVGSVKEIGELKNYVSIDGGMPDNPRYALYGSAYTVMLANRAEEKADFKCSIAGRCCESGDLIQEGVMLPRPKRGDTLAVLVTGAYNYSMASNYNKIPRPAVLLVGKSGERIAVRRETFEDLCLLDN
ncbi:MAG: diaminopimelate decarboxylase [Ruminococcaceae bacterium]|nr:diaminopimelate decarboxylase [Oscillospiraceae bacterium]